MEELRTQTAHEWAVHRAGLPVALLKRIWSSIKL